MESQTDLTVRSQIDVECPRQLAFGVFVDKIGSWWPLDVKAIGANPAETAVIEPRVGGRWFERDANGVECDWGKVLEYEPDSRLVLTWQIGADWTFDPSIETRVELDFDEVDESTTRVTLTHTGLEEAYGDSAAMMNQIFASEDGWSGILSLFAATART